MTRPRGHRPPPLGTRADGRSRLTQTETSEANMTQVGHIYETGFRPFPGRTRIAAPDSYNIVLKKCEHGWFMKHIYYWDVGHSADEPWIPYKLRADDEESQLDGLIRVDSYTTEPDDANTSN